MNDVQFHYNTKTIMIHGNKNDYDRDGFKVTVPAAKNVKLDPVKALQRYMARTESQN